MKTEQEIRERIKELKYLSKLWYKLNKMPNRMQSRGSCVANRNSCLAEIKYLEWVLGYWDKTEEQKQATKNFIKRIEKFLIENGKQLPIQESEDEK